MLQCRHSSLIFYSKIRLQICCIASQAVGISGGCGLLIIGFACDINQNKLNFVDQLFY